MTNFINDRWSNPTEEDYQRVKNIKSDAQAQQMANSIKDRRKIVKRARAYIDTYGPGDNPFVRRMKEFGYNNSHIIEVSYPFMKNFIQKYTST